MDLSYAEFSRKDLAKNITISNKFNELLAEDIGIHIGDGSLYRGATSKKFEISYSHHINEKEHTNFIKEMKFLLFNVQNI